jgi:hypothetical protein
MKVYSLLKSVSKSKSRLMAVSVFALLVLSMFAGLIPQAKATTIFSDGFESGNFSAWTELEGAPEVVTDYAHHGSYSCKIDAQEGPYKDLGASYSTLWMRVYVYFTALPQFDGYRAGIIQISNAAKWGWGIFAEAYRDNGVTNFTLFNPNTRVDSNVTVQTGKWYCVELKFSSVSGVDCELWIDGVQKATVAYFPYGGADRVGVGYGSAGAGGAVQYIDCVVVADTGPIGPEGGADTTPPTCSNIGANTTTPGQPCQFSVE